MNNPILPRLLSGLIHARKPRSSNRAVFKYCESALEWLTQQVWPAIAELIAPQSSRQLRQNGVV